MEDARSKPLVVLVPDAMEWILGSWALEITEANADAFEFIVFPASQIDENPGRFAEVVQKADVLHCLTPSGFGLDKIRDRVKEVGSESLRVVASIHHIVRFEDIRPCIEADAVCVMCDEVRNVLITKGVPDEKIFTLRKGVDTDFFERHNPLVARRRLGIDENDFVVGFSAKAGSDDGGRKGIDTFLRVVARLPEALAADVTVALTGPGCETFGTDVRIPGLEWQHVPYLSCEDMPDFYSAIDVYLSTARIEGGPMSVFEAMSCQTPVVSTAIGMVRDLVTDGVDGLIVPIDDVEKTLKALSRLHHDARLCQKIATAGRETVIQRLGWQDVAREARKAYTGTSRPERTRSLSAHAARAISDELIANDRSRWARKIPKYAGKITPLMRPPRRGPRSSEVVSVDLEELGVRPGVRVLDLGCGSGRFSLPMLGRGYRMVSVDLDEPRLKLFHELATKDNLKGRPTRSDAANLAFETACFDAVVCREMLERIADPAPVMDEIRRVLRPGGRLCIIVPSSRTERWFQWVNPEWLEMCGHVHVYSRKELTRILKAAGFRVLKVRGRNFFDSLFWFFHTFAKTRHDGTGAIQEHWALAQRIQNFWRRLGNGRLKRGIEAIGDRLLPKRYLYYCVRTDEEIPRSAARAARPAPSPILPAPGVPTAGPDS